MTYHNGLMVNPMPTQRDTIIYAELTPATGLIRWAGYRRPGWRRYWPLATGRTWSEPHIRWWFEIHEEQRDKIGKHWWRHDGGATTLRGAIRKASDAVNQVVELVWEEMKTTSSGGLGSQTGDNQ